MVGLRALEEPRRVNMTTKIRAQKAPAPGTYVGTVDGCNAIFAVSAGGVEAIWYRASRFGLNGFAQESDAWGVDDGKFRPSYRGETVEVKISTRSHIPHDEVAA
jgi:hypothetical protein